MSQSSPVYNITPNFSIDIDELNLFGVVFELFWSLTFRMMDMTNDPGVGAHMIKKDVFSGWGIFYEHLTVHISEIPKSGNYNS